MSLADLGLKEESLGAGLIGTATSGAGTAAAARLAKEKFGADQWANLGAGVGNSLSALVAEILKGRK